MAGDLTPVRKLVERANASFLEAYYDYVDEKELTEAEEGTCGRTSISLSKRMIASLSIATHSAAVSWQHG